VPRGAAELMKMIVMLHPIKITVTVVTAVVCMMIIGCASVPTASPGFEQEAMKFSPPPEMAAVYVYRPFNVFGSAVLFLVSIDYKDFGSVSTDTYLFGTIRPGLHVIKTGGGIPLSVASAKFDAEAGRLYFFKISPGWTGIKIEQVDEKKGHDSLRDLRLSGDNAFEFSHKIQE
jgi:hypothetical protein